MFLKDRFYTREFINEAMNFTPYPYDSIIGFQDCLGIFNTTPFVPASNLNNDLNLNQEYYLQEKSNFLTKYLNQYIAIVNCQVIDFDLDFSRLAKRVRKSYDLKKVFITKVIQESRVTKILTPFNLSI